MLTLKEFQGTAAAVSIEEASEALQEDLETFKGAEKVWLFDETIYALELSRPDYEGVGTYFYTVIERETYQALDLNEIAALLYFDWYAFECVSFEDYTVENLTTLLDDFRQWRGLRNYDAEELLYAFPPNSKWRRWLEYYIELWGKVA